MTLAELARIAKTKGDEHRWLVSEQRKERERDARKNAETSRLRRVAKRAAYAQAPYLVGTVAPQVEESATVSMTLSPLSTRQKAPMTDTERPCWQCGQVGHWAAQCPKLDPRLRAQLAEVQERKTQRAPLMSWTESTRSVALAQPHAVEASSPTEEGEDSTPTSGEGSDSPSNAGGGNK